MNKLAFGFVSLIFLAASPASAAGQAPANWIVTQLSGDTRVVHPGAQPASLKVNNQLSPGDTLLTGPTGRATLVHGGDYIIVAPHSALRLPSTPQPTGFTRVIQNLGTLLFKVQHTGIPHFAVDTPMLAAVVKGTTFTVVVDGNRSAVQVIQGVVQVSTIDGAMSRMVEGGRTVFVNHEHPKVLLDADKPLPARGSPAPATAVTVSAAGESPLAAIGSLTGGLVRADISSPQPAAIASSATLTVASAAPAPATTSTPVTAAAPTVSNQPTPGAAPTTTNIVTAPVTVVANGPSTPSAGVVPAPVTVATAPAVSTPVLVTSTVTVPTVTAPALTVPTVSTPTVTAPSLSTPTVTTPIIAVAPVTTPTVTIPTVTIASNSGPGPMNSGPGSINSGPGSVSSPTVSVPSVSTPTVTVPSLTTPTISTPLVTVPSISTPTVTVPALTTPTISLAPVTAPITSLLKL